MRSRKWKHKEGRGTSHSYWSRTHGPRGTTHGTSGRRPWLWMVSRRGFLLPAGCRGSFSKQPRSRNGGGGTEASSRKRDRYWGFPPRGLNIGGGGVEGTHRAARRPPKRGLGWGRARDPSGVPVVAPLRCLGDSGSFRVADFLSDFSDFLEHF